MSKDSTADYLLDLLKEVSPKKLARTKKEIVDDILQDLIRMEEKRISLIKSILIYHKNAHNKDFVRRVYTEELLEGKTPRKEEYEGINPSLFLTLKYYNATQKEMQVQLMESVTDMLRK